jgi:DNA-binding transcriptional LysR family regulator
MKNMTKIASSTSSEVELRSWQQFLTLANYLHFGRAAEALGMTQPPLTQAIQKLESKLGVKLFERTRRNVRLLPAGRALMTPTQALLDAASALPSLARDASTGKTGTLRLGFVSTVGFDRLPGWLRGFREEYPGIAIQLKEATLDVQLEAFADKKLDAGFVLHAGGAVVPKATTLEHCSVGIEPFVFALPDAITPSVKSLTSAQLLAQPLVIFPRSTAPSLYDAILAFYHRHGTTPTIVQEAIQMQTIVNLVSAGLGVALVPRTIAKLRRSGVKYRNIPRNLRVRSLRCETNLVWRKDEGVNVQHFVDYVKRFI